ncbi:MAG: hypothetical protein K0Q77_1609 [Anaerosporomusa subterranea]|jgi:hypothetical protein|nr:hypothetical protein [Anaerosporomusa subterranea]
MLLASLQTKREQEAFLSLAHLVAKADGNFDYASAILIGMYQEEMGLEKAPAHLQGLPVSDLCRVFTDANSKHLVFLNLFSLAHVDGNSNMAKKSVLETIRQELAVSISEAKRLESEIKIVTASYYPSFTD